MTSSASTRERRRGISTSTPRRCSRYARSPPIFTAEAAGTGSSISPRRPASRCSSSAGLGASCRSRSRPSRSPVSVTAPRSTSVEYRLSRPTKHEASLVVEPDNTSNSPLANGSSVPACPVRAPVRRRTSATTRNDDGPSGLSTSRTPLGLSARGGTRRLEELAAEELDDLVDRLIGREARRLAMAPSTPLPGDRRNIDLVVRGPERNTSGRARRLRRLADHRGHLRAVHLTNAVDDPLRVLLPHAEVLEVGPEEVGDDQPAALVDRSPLRGAPYELQVRQRHTFVDLLRGVPGIHARTQQASREVVRLRSRVRVPEAPRVGHQRDVDRLGDLPGQLDAELVEDPRGDLPGRRGPVEDEVDRPEARVVVVVIDVDRKRHLVQQLCGSAHASRICAVQSQQDALGAVGWKLAQKPVEVEERQVARDSAPARQEDDAVLAEPVEPELHREQRAKSVAVRVL